MNKHFTSKLTVIAAALMAVYGQAQAEDDEVRQYSKPDSSISVGIAGTKGDRQQFGKFDGVTKDDTHLQFDVNVHKRDDASGTWTNFSTRNIDYDNRELKVDYEQQGNLGVSLEYSQTPSNNPNAIKTGVHGVGSSTLTYGGIGTATTSAAATTDAQNKLFSATGDVHLGTRRDTTTLNIVKYLMPNLSFNFTFKNEDKKGSRAWGRGVNPEFAAEPIDWNTRQIDGILNYADKALQLSGGFSGSWFSNANSFVDTIGGSQTNVTAASATTNAAGHTFLSLPLDNQAYQLFLNGGYNFSKTTRGTFKAAYTHATQNASLSPITNALIASGAGGTSTHIPFAGEPSGLDGEVNTKLLEFGLSARPISKLAIVANLRYQNRDDKTPERAFGKYWTYRCSTTGTTTYYLGATPTSANCASGTANTISGPTEIDNNPRDFKNLAGKLEATYQLPDGYSLTGGVNYDKRERGFEIDPSAGEYLGVVKMRGKTDETTWRLQLARALSETVSGSIAYLHSKRDGSTWNPAEGAADADLPLNFVNPAPYADRKRNQWRMMLDWAPTDAMSLQFNLEHAKDEYGAGRSGLQDGSAQLLSLDAFYAISPDWQLNGWLSHDTTKSHQIGYTYDTRTTTPINWACSSAPGATISAGCTTDLIWDANLKDTGNSLGIGLKGNATARTKLGANLQWTRNKSQYPIASNVPSYNSGATAGPTTTSNRSQQGLPDITSTLTRLALYAEYALDKTSDLRFDMVHERWKSNDWTFMEWNSSGTDLMPFTYMDGTTVTAKQNQTATFLGVRYIYKFQ